VVEELAGEGIALVVGYAANRAEAKEAVAAAEAKGAQAIAMPADVADEVAMSEPFDAAESTFGGLQRLRREQGRGRGNDLYLGPRTARAGRHRQRCRAGTDRHGHVS
jgi:NAD(P)-dependent dehydrogenase (short-subunit alcohol dehydrogenase family)